MAAFQSDRSETPLNLDEAEFACLMARAVSELPRDDVRCLLHDMLNIVWTAQVDTAARH